MKATHCKVVRPLRKIMKQFALRLVSLIIVQQSSMIFFMRVVRWDIFVSAGLAALIAAAFGLVAYFIQKRLAARRSKA
jgi:hypothetical protein